MAALEETKGGDCKDDSTVKRSSRPASERAVENFHFISCTEVKKELEEAPDKEVDPSEEHSLAECEACVKEQKCKRASSYHASNPMAECTEPPRPSKAGTFEEISVPGCNVQLKQEVDEFFREPETKKKRIRERKEMCLDTPLRNTDDCYALGNYVSAKLRKMNQNQQILAEALIQKVITRGMRNQLTDNTDMYETPPRQVFTIPFIPSLSSPFVSYGSPFPAQPASSSAASYSTLGKH